MFKFHSKGGKDFMKQSHKLMITNLSEGMLVKNYKEMCKLLGCNPLEGNSKRSQIKNWKRYFDFERVGQKFVITKIYPEPYPIEDARKLKEGLYVKYIELLMLRYLSGCNGYQTKISKSELYSILGLTNENYKCLRKNSKAIKEKIMQNSRGIVNISYFDIHHFYQRADAKLTKVLYTALDSMSKRFLIKYKTEYVIITGCSECKETFSTKIANQEEVNCIIDMQHAVLNEMGFTTITQVSLKYKLNEFNKRVNQYLFDKYGWKGVYSQLSITYINNIAKETPLKAEEICKLSASVQRKQLNQIVIKSLNSQAHDKFEKNRDSVVDILVNEEDATNVFLYSDTYVEAQETLTYYLIDIDAEIYRDNTDNSNIDMINL